MKLLWKNSCPPHAPWFIGDLKQSLWVDNRKSNNTGSEDKLCIDSHCYKVSICLPCKLCMSIIDLSGDFKIVNSLFLFINTFYCLAWVMTRLFSEIYSNFYRLGMNSKLMLVDRWNWGFWKRSKLSTRSIIILASLWNASLAQQPEMFGLLADSKNYTFSEGF